MFELQMTMFDSNKGQTIYSNCCLGCLSENITNNVNFDLYQLYNSLMNKKVNICY